MAAYLILTLCFACLSPSMFAQVQINEYSAHRGLEDNGVESDWIELLNTGNAVVQMDDLFLSDDPSELYKWSFPEYPMLPDEIVLICLSGLDITTRVHHWESVVLAENSWSYFLGSSEPPADWNEIAFDHNTWPEGPGGIGYGDGDDNTLTPSLSSFYIRQEFSIDDLDLINGMVLSADYDDGFVAYLNGTEIARSDNLIGQPPTFDTYTESDHEAALYSGGTPDQIQLSLEAYEGILLEGNNVLAVQVHNFSPTSSDMTAIFYLSVGIPNITNTYSPVPQWFSAENSNSFFHSNFKLDIGEYALLTDMSTILDFDLVPDDMRIGLSRGRPADGADTWCYFDTPTPEQDNTGSMCFEGVAESPEVSLPSGWYTSGQWAFMNSPGNTVRYTTNGDIPDESDPIPAGALPISATGILSARSFSSDDLLPSAIVDRTYIVNQDNHDLPVVSIKTDSLNLWGFNEGIYVSGPNATPFYPFFGSNFWEPWSKFARMELFGADQTILAEEYFDLEIHGGWSRAEPQKSFRCDFKSIYTGRLDVPLFSTKPDLPDFNNINLRNGGQHIGSDKIQDAVISRLAIGTHVDRVAFEPCIVYLNGQYWGIYGIREKMDEHYIEDNHDVDAEEVDLLNSFGTLVGSDEDFISDVQELMSEPINSPAFYDLLSSHFDIDNYIDYFIIQTFVQNTDWMGIAWGPNNIKLWRPQTADGKWRYMLYDTDGALGAFGSMPEENYLQLARDPDFPTLHSQLFDRALDNDEFKCSFSKRYADLMNTIFRQSNVDEKIDLIAGQLLAAMPDHVERWEAPAGVLEWLFWIDVMRNRVSERLPFARAHVNTTLDLEGQVNVTLNVVPEGAGTIRISTVEPDGYPWTGVYFNGCPVMIEAIANDGNVFSYWSENEYLLTPNTEESLMIDFAVDDVFTANFDSPLSLEEHSSNVGVLLYPNPTKGDVRIRLSALIDQSVDLRISDSTARCVYKDSYTGGSTSEDLILDLRHLDKGIYMVELTTQDQVFSQQLVIR